MIQLGVLISGRGSNMRSIVRACRDGRVPAEVAVVISNRASAPGLVWAAENGVRTAVIAHGDYPDRETHDRAIIQVLRQERVEWVCLAGYMRLLSAVFIAEYESRALNIHPSLLPAFPGLHAQRQAVRHGVRVSGCTVHLVDVELDHGPIVVQRAVSLPEAADEAEVTARILEQEHLAYPQALKMLLERPWRLDERRLEWLDESRQP